MIVYFSGTGNSAYVAKRLQRELQDEGFDLFSSIRQRKKDTLYAKQPWVIVAPTYAWRIPRIVQEWLENATLTGNRDIYFVMTCGGSIGNAGRYLEKLCAARKLHYLGCVQIKMPENYIAMFSTPTQEEALDLIQQSEAVIDKAALTMKRGEPIPQPALTAQDKISSGIINDIFYPAFVHAKKFSAADTCISCGKCVKVCPLNNIRLEAGKPVCGKNCTHCMACICRCPAEAIEYGKHSKGMPRYVCPKTM